jgi:hypothetical protein
VLPSTARPPAVTGSSSTAHVVEYTEVVAAEAGPMESLQQECPVDE